MTQNSGNESKVLWSELLPSEFKKRLTECPIVYLPLGICEPHGQIAAFGLDTIKAEWLCENAARAVGGIVAPSLGYHIHESGYHARWLEETIGEENPHMTAMPPHVLLHFFLYQLRAFANAGFGGIMVVSGHSGGNQFDLRRVAEVFTRRTTIPVWVASDPELVSDLFKGDHAGKYEISQLIYLRPDLVDRNKAILAIKSGTGGSFAIGQDADQADEQLGEAIMRGCLEALIFESENMKGAASRVRRLVSLKLTFEITDNMWQEIWQARAHWRTSKPSENQTPVSSTSQWLPYENTEYK
jgi:creatinine amidohydrolase